jgi:hypothetical protein
MCALLDEYIFAVDYCIWVDSSLGLLKLILSRTFLGFPLSELEQEFLLGFIQKRKCRIDIFSLSR